MVIFPISRSLHISFYPPYEQKIAFVPGSSFYPVEHKENTFRINYSNMPEDRIMKGLQVIGEVLKEYIHQLK